jgi:hypothetical protein
MTMLLHILRQFYTHFNINAVNYMPFMQIVRQAQAYRLHIVDSLSLTHIFILFYFIFLFKNRKEEEEVT